MNTDRLKLARRPAPSGRMAHSAGVLPARDCSARKIEPEWFAVRGFSVPVRYARPGAPPTAGKECRGGALMTEPKSKSHCPRHFRATVTRYPRNDYRCRCNLHGLSAFANFPRPFHGYELSAVFPQSRTVLIHVPSASTIQPQSVHCLSKEHSKSGNWFSHLQYARCWNGFIAVPVFEWRLPLARGVCVQAFRSPVSAYRLLSVCRELLFAFSVASLASSNGRPNLSCCVVLSNVAGLLFRHSGRRAGLPFVSFTRPTCIHLLAVVGWRSVCPLRQWPSVAAIQRVPMSAQSESERE